MIDTTAGKVAASIPVAGYPGWAALSPDGTRLYVTKFDGVAVIDTGRAPVTGG